MIEIQHWNGAAFRKNISSGLVLVDFYGEWCGPCKILAKTLETVAAEVPDTVKIGKIDVAEAAAEAAEYGVTSIPTLILFKDGKAVSSIVGAGSKDEILSLLKIDR